MKQTADKVFIDSNILIYCYASAEPEKQQIAFRVIDDHTKLYISTQVIQEFCNIVYKKFSQKEIDLGVALSEIESIVSIHNNTIETVKKANAIKSKYGYSFYDSLIIATALE